MITQEEGRPGQGNPGRGVDTNELSMTGSNAQSTFATTWNENDLAVLNPIHLQRSKPLRAWERKPLSPFARNKTGVKKIWKRPVVSSAGRVATSTARLEQGHHSSTPTKTTKRRCVTTDHSVETQWERLASPTKRIVTRSSGAKDLIALSEEDVEEPLPFGPFDVAGRVEESDGTIIEVLDDEGRTIRVQEADNESADEWTDEGEVDFDDTMMHLEEAIEHVGEVRQPESNNYLGNSIGKDAGEDVGEIVRENNTSGAQLQSELTDSQSPPPATAKQQTVLIPAGFVSPVKRRRTVSKRLQEANRRRSVPYAFAPEIRLPPTTNSTSAAQSAIDESPPKTHSTQNTISNDSQATPSVSEDLQQDSADANSSGTEQDSPGSGSLSDHHDTPLLEPTPLSSAEQTGSAEQIDSALGAASTEMKSKNHQPIQLRRSPRRRKSSSPMKARTLAAAPKQGLHYVALSPVANTRHNGLTAEEETRPSQAAQSIILQSPLLSAGEAKEDMSAESPSPRKTVKARLSDDTAFLQAFLDRAAGSKSTADLDTAAKEAVFNRRDSATIKHAMSSPDKATVLLEMDPNSPSPSKASAVSRSPSKVGSDRQTLVHADEDDIEEDRSNDRELEQPRRSNRDRRTVERIVPAVPTRITLRGNKAVQSFKPTAAQEMLLLTRKNTRFNKGDAIMPRARVVELEADSPEITDNTSVQTSTKLKSVTWNDTPDILVLDMTATQAEAEDAGIKHTPVSIGVATQSRGRPSAYQSASKVLQKKTRARVLKAPGTPRLNTSQRADASPERPKQMATILDTDKSTAITSDKMSLAMDARSSATGLTASARAKARMPSRLPAPKTSFASTLDASRASGLSARDEVLGVSLAMASPAKRRVSTFDRKLFSGNSSNGAVSSDADQTASQALPLLASPAKKIRRAVIFGSGQLDGQPVEASSRMRETPGLASPAKKRIR